MDYDKNLKFRAAALDVGKQTCAFIQNKTNPCVFAFTKERLKKNGNDLFAPCVYASYHYGTINSKEIMVFDNRESTIEDIKKEHDGIILMKCVSNAPEYTVKSKILSDEFMEITFYIKEDIFTNEDGFTQCISELSGEI